MNIETTAIFPILSLIIFLPFIGGIILFFIPKQKHSIQKSLSFAISFVTFLISLSIFYYFDDSKGGFQLVEEKNWLPFGMKYFLGIDGISLFLVILTAFLSPIVILSAFRAIEKKQREFYISILFLETAMLGAFLALDLFLFYIFWEFMLIPMYIIIGVWGGERRIYAAIKFFIYTMFGSILMLVAIIYIYIKGGSKTFSLIEFLKFNLSTQEQIFLFSAFSLSFAIKVPLFPFHTWLPDAHVEAPTAGSVILAGILLKMGTYGFLRFAIPLFPVAAGYFSIPLMVLAVIGVVYGALMAYAQRDIKKLVAYSSVSHLGLVMLGMFIFNEEGIEGSILQMINHGISTGALFLIVGILYERRHTRIVDDFGGIATPMPVFAAIFVIITLSSIGLPGTNGFIGEILIFAGTIREGLTGVIEKGWKFSPYQASIFIMGIFALSGVILGAIYMLTMIRRVLFGSVVHHENKNLKDCTLRENFVLIPLVVIVFLIGLFPNIFLGKMEGSVNSLMKLYRDRINVQRVIETEACAKFNLGWEGDFSEIASSER